MSPVKGLDAPTIMRIGAARLTAGLDRMPRLDLEAHRDIFGPLPRLSAEELISMTEQVDLRGQGGAAFPFARKLSAVVKNAEANDCAPVVVVNATEGEPGSAKDKMLMIRSPYLILSGAALVAEAIGAEEIVIGVAGNELANRSMEAAIAAEPGLRKIARMVQLPDRFISGESGALVRGINGKRPVPPGRKVLASDFGVADLPTLLSNAATFAQLAVLALLGPERFAAVGTPEEPGTVLLSVGGSAAHPAVVEVPTGVPLAAVLDICQAPRATASWSAATTACGCRPARRTWCRSPVKAWPPSAARSARGSCSRSVTGPARWARCPGSRATWPASRRASADRASSACPPSHGPWRR